MTIALKKNVPGFRDANGVFRPIRSASYVGGGSSRRRATAKDRKKYSRAKAGDLGKTRQERALEAPWDREYRLEQEAKAAQKREQDRIEKQIAAEVYGETSGRTSRGKGKSLAQFIRSEGGINTRSKVRKGRVRYGDSLENFTRKGSGSTGLVTTTPGKGKSLDYMYQAAREAGYDVASMDDLLDALDNELRSGKKTYSTHGSMTYNPAKVKLSAARLRELDYYVINDPPSKLFIVKQLGTKGNLATFGTQAAAMAFIRKLAAANKTAAKKNPAYVNGKWNVAVPRSMWLLFDREGVTIGQIRKEGGKYRAWDRAGGSPLHATLIAAKGWVAKRKNRKPNPDLLGMFANAAVGIASTLQINEMMKSRKRAAAPKKRGTTKAKRRNPVAGKRSTARKNPRSAIRNPRSGQPNLFKRQPKGELYVLTIGSGDDLISVYLHDGDKDGFSKRFKTMAAAKTFATRNKVKMVENPKQNGIIKRAWARSRAASEYRRELRLEAAADRARKRRQKAEAKAKANPPAKRGKTAVARAANGKKAVARSAKANPRHIERIAASKYYGKHATGSVIVVDGYPAFHGTPAEATDFLKRLKGETVKPRPIAVALSDRKRREKPRRYSIQRAIVAKKAKRKNPRSAIRNPRSTARRRTFEMFQGRKVTTARPMMVSNHAPANLDALGDLVELKIAGGPTLKFNGKGTKLCAAGGKLWIAGKRFAKANPAAKANELNPIGEIDHVVYGTYKPHHGDHDYTHYIHKLGEESGKRPILCVDREGFPVIRGGNYKIEARGIVD